MIVIQRSTRKVLRFFIWEPALVFYSTAVASHSSAASQYWSLGTICVWISLYSNDEHLNSRHRAVPRPDLIVEARATVNVAWVYKKRQRR
jgi:hypothetical protein